jgi:tetratricopeptide (TPR) repeat protein
MSADYYQPAPIRRSTQIDSKPLARYDVRSELHDKPAAKVVARAQTSTPPKAVPIKKASIPEPSTKEAPKSSSPEISESDLPVAPHAEAKLAAPASLTSSECKEASSERDKAAEASDNSDKLFHLRRALRLCPQNAPLHYDLGRVYASMDRGSDAEREFKQALSIDPSLAAAKKALSDMLKEEVQF